MTDINILWIGLILYMIGLIVALKFKLKWLFIGTSVLWFMPIILVDNIFIVVFSVLMIIGTIAIAIFSGKGEEEW